MGTPGRRLVVALGLIAAGVALFLLYLGLTGHGDDGQAFGLLDWVVAGVLIAPGFRALIQWRAARDAARRG